jgi:transcriptional regulator with PAS, ATPase and Fis domain
MKKKVCYIGCSESTCNYIFQKLTHFLGEYVEAKIWCLQHEPTLPYPTCDIYIAASKTIYESVKSQLPAHKPVLLATRIIDTENLDKLLELTSGTKAIVVAVSEEAALSTINILSNFGIDYLALTPYYPGCGIELTEDIAIAITPGVSYLVPRSIKKVVDVGVRGIDISTFGELIQQLNLPMDVTNRISHDYIKAILNLSLRHYRIASINVDLNRKLEVILKTVDEAIVAVNESNKIIVFNPAAERLLDINSVQVLDKDVREVIPQVDFISCLKTGVGSTKEIKLVNNNDYIVSINPINVEANKISGVVASFRQVIQTKEPDEKYRRALRSKGNTAKYIFSHIVGNSNELVSALTLARRFAKTDLTVLLEGESGTGKEVFAQAIHNFSERKNEPFVAVNFAAIPQNLVESELFGYEDGAFTGAKKGGNAGLFEEAHLGTIFIDEIGDASLEVQKRLLRVLEEKKVRRVGSGTQIPIDVRVIAATNQDLQSLVRQGRFRTDLFYRLCALPIAIPSLQARGEDIFILIDYLARKNNNRELKLEAPLKEFFLNYRWPGNIRELQNVVDYLCNMVMSDEAATIKHLPAYLVRNNVQKEVLYHKTQNASNEQFEALAIQLKRQDLLQSIVMILSEIYNASLLNKGVGRQTIQKNLCCHEGILADHKVRQWLKTLEEMGYIVSGKTKQGSKITREGELFLGYIKERYKFTDFKESEMQTI